MAELTTQIEEQGGITKIHINGYLSSDNSPALDEAFAQLGEAKKILLIFREDDMVASAGIAVLFDLCIGAMEKGQEVRIVQPAAHFRKVFKLVGAESGCAGVRR
jgi:anti-anti-sigma factor